MCAGSVSNFPPPNSASLMKCRITAAYLRLLNKKHARSRHMDGRPENVADESLLTTAEATGLRSVLGGSQSSQGAKALSILNSRAFDDLTDLRNMDFIYVL